MNLDSWSFHDEERVLVIAPTARDAQLSQDLFTRAGLACAVCQDLSLLALELAHGAGVLVLTEEILTSERRQFVVTALAVQPTWSSLPIIMLAGTSPQQLLALPIVQQLGNVLVLERPISSQTLLSVVQLALRMRRRQYQARVVAEASTLLSTFLGEDETLADVVRLLVPRFADCCLLVLEDGNALRVAASTFAEGEHAAEMQLQAMLGGAGLTPPDSTRRGAHRQPEADQALEEEPSTKRVERCLEAIGAGTSLVMPLELPELRFGSLSLGMLGSGRTFPPDERQVVQEVVRHLALALNQAQLYHAAQAASTAAEAAMRSRDELLALISHDLNNPLTVVVGQVQILQRQRFHTSLPERVQRGLAAIGSAALQMQAQIAELLDAARLRAGRPEVRREAIDLLVLARRVVEAVQQGTERHQLDLHTPLTALVVEIDPIRLERVLDNLLSNAVKYSPAGGPVTVTITVEETDAATWAVMRVQDEGIGIPAADLPHVFERFRRGSNVTPALRGTGLGLASVQQIVEEHGGKVMVDSSSGTGTRVTMYLPCRVGA